MTDVFNQDWTNRMKNEVFTNKLLNNWPTEHPVGFMNIVFKKKQRRKSRHGKYTYIVRDTVYTGNYDQSVGNSWWRLNHAYGIWPGKNRAVPNRKYASYQDIDVIRPGSDVDPVQEYWSNTRPNSLYNLRYASQR